MGQNRSILKVVTVGAWFIFGAVLGVASVAYATDELPYQDEAFPCMEADQAERYIRDFNINVGSFGGEELCNPAVDTRKLLSDLFLIEEGRFRADGENVFDRGNVSAGDYYGWSRSMTRGVRRGHDIPYATAYNSGGYFTMQDGWAALSTLGRVGTFIHEARHTAGYRHYRCTNGPYADSFVSGCDTSLRQGGSHGVEMEYYARVVVRGENFHPVYQAMARLMAIGRGNWVFNEPAISRREALVAVEETSGQPLLVDGTRVLERVGPTIGQAVLKRSSFGASYFDGSRARAIDLYGIAQGTENMQDDYSYFKFLNGERNRLPGMRDLEEFDIGVKRYMVALTDDGRIYKYIFADGAWSDQSTVAIPNADRIVTTSPSGERGLFVLRTDGMLVRYNVEAHTLGETLTERWDESVRAYVRSGQNFYKLTRSGLVWFAQDGEWIPYPELAGYGITQLESVPLYDAFSVTL